MNIHSMQPAAVRLQESSVGRPHHTWHTCTRAGTGRSGAILGLLPGWTGCAATILGFSNNEYSRKGMIGPNCSNGRSAAAILHRQSRPSANTP